MTVYVVVAIKDSALNAFMQPVFTPSVGLAQRSFADEVNNRESPMSRHPEDYSLYQLGSWTDVTGLFIQMPEPVLVVRGKDVVLNKE